MLNREVVECIPSLPFWCHGAALRTFWVTTFFCMVEPITWRVPEGLLPPKSLSGCLSLCFAVTSGKALPDGILSLLPSMCIKHLRLVLLVTRRQGDEMETCPQVSADNFCCQCLCAAYVMAYVGKASTLAWTSGPLMQLATVSFLSFIETSTNPILNSQDTNPSRQINV